MVCTKNGGRRLNGRNLKMKSGRQRWLAHRAKINYISHKLHTILFVLFLSPDLCTFFRWLLPCGKSPLVMHFKLSQPLNLLRCKVASSKDMDEMLPYLFVAQQQPIENTSVATLFERKDRKLREKICACFIFELHLNYCSANGFQQFTENWIRWQKLRYSSFHIFFF